MSSSVGSAGTSPPPVWLAGESVKVSVVMEMTARLAPQLGARGRALGPRRGFPLSSGVVCRGPGSLGKSPKEPSGAGFTVTVTDSGLNPVLPTFPGIPVVGLGSRDSSGQWAVVRRHVN